MKNFRECIDFKGINCPSDHEMDCTIDCVVCLSYDCDQCENFDSDDMTCDKGNDVRLYCEY